ncbi:MAG TPA: 2-oxoglutarate dehydrogenase E1 component [Tepidisphaeraceae bacterium]|jgi:2-oxoglutarate dehydrogenase E1 component|nr:2-oxoglutarate dehydrogenase E1 component [Tepidisphaeraceae bacterium]
MHRSDFLNRANADYVDSLYEQYLRDPLSVDDVWRAYFAGFEDAGGRTAPTDARAVPLNIGIHDLVHSYRELGHFVATLDPLGHLRESHPLLDLQQFGMSEADLDMMVGKADFYGETDGTLRDLLAKLQATYCRNIGVEYMGISDKAQREWLAKRMEPILNKPSFSAEETKALMFQLVVSEDFERFLRTKWKGKKTFSLEGAESVVALLNSVVDDGAMMGIEEICMGMAHRGRLNVLAHVLNKPYEVIFSEFQESIAQECGGRSGEGDVKYHLGYANDRPTRQNRPIHIGLSPNPSHLELVNPVVEGIVRAKQNYRDDREQNRVVPVLIHGDAAFTGQGIVFETLNLSELRGWRTGGTIHIIINNQIGFTTPPEQGRFTPYPTDVAKMIQAPIFHVNGDDPEACVHAARLATAFREEFKCDVMIDVWCYRRFGHNETDEAPFTQPLMYAQIAKQPTTRDIYARKVVEEGRLKPELLDEMKKIARERMDKAYALAQEYKPRQRTAVINKLWKDYLQTPTDWSAKTAVSREMLSKVTEAATKVPADFTPHPKLARLLTERREAVIRNGYGIDWGCGEMLAFATLLMEGTPVRLTGQDVQRGTFSHRHAVLHDYNTGRQYVPLANLQEGQPPIAILNSMLSEEAVLGFEYGFSSADPRNLVCWEAQFGDFVNGAQAIIDQFIAAAESKWRLSNGLVMLLPHGHEGAGPEHSYAYFSRFLALCAVDNMQVCQPSTPAQVFHMLRRQIHRKFRKPLVMMMPKALLRYEPSFSRVDDFASGSVSLVLDDPTPPDTARVKRLLFCTGKVYYTLSKARTTNNIADTAIVRVEQLYPFPKPELQAILAKYSSATEINWVQEEPRNRGAWHFINDRFDGLLPGKLMLNYIGREEAASPATGLHDMHEKEEAAFTNKALGIKCCAEAKVAETAAATVAVPAAVAVATAPVTQAGVSPNGTANGAVQIQSSGGSASSVGRRG